MKKPTISVVMPIYIIDKELDDITVDCINSLKATGKDYELIIIDNNSTYKVKHNADIYVKNKENMGNGYAWKQGMRLARGKYILLADNDVVFPDDWEKLKYKCNNAIAFPETYLMDNPGYAKRLAGFFWMISKTDYKKLGDISMDYGLANFEDTDYFMRAQKAGMKLVCTDEVKVMHLSRSTCKKVKEVNDIYETNKKIYEEKFGGEYPKLN